MIGVSVLAVLLSSSEDVNLDLSKVSIALVAAAAIATIVWLLVLVAFAILTRPKPVEAGPSTMDLGPESPAVADFLVNHGNVTARAVPATLLDLASRHFLQIEEYGETDTIIRLRQQATPDLAPYEKQMLQQVAGLAENGIVPIQALTLGTAGRAANWRSAFDKEVTREAKSRGLSEDRWNLQTWTAQRAVGFVAGALVVGVAAQAGAWQVGVGAVFLAAAGAHAVLMKIFGTQKLTAAGYSAASHWLGVRAYLAQGEAFDQLPPGAVVLWDRYFAYAAAFGLARAALAKMPIGAEDDHRAWSGYGGEWHSVHVSYPRARIVWGRSPFGALFTGAVIAAAGAGIVWLMLQVHGFANDYHDQVARWVQLGSLVAAAGGVAVIAWGLRTAGIALADFGTKSEVRGEVVRCRTYQRNNGNKIDHFVAVDDGTDHHVKAWLVEPAIYNAVHEGDTVSATISPRLRHVSKIDVTSASHLPQVSQQPAATTAPRMPNIPGLANLAAGFTASVDPATLVTADEAAAALGGPVKPVQPFMEPGTNGMLPRGCLYAAASGGHDGVSVATASGPMVKMLSSLYARSHSVNAIDIAGGQAYLQSDAIALVTGETVVMIRVHGGKGDTRAALQQLATQAASRLPGAATASASTQA